MAKSLTASQVSDEFARQCAAGWSFRSGIYFSPQVTAVSYPEDRRQTNFEIEEQSFWFRHRRKCIETVLRRFPPAEGVFLDIGGGNGYMTSALQSLGFAAVLIEPGSEGCFNAKSRGISTVLCGTAADLNSASATPSSAGLFDVLEHVSDDKVFLEQIFEILPPGGRLYLTVPAVPSLWSREDELAGHFRRYTPASLKACIQSSGFQEVFTSYFFLNLIPAVFLLRALPWHFRKPSESVSTKSHRANHLAKGGGARRLALLSLIPELYWLKISKIPYGTSLVCVAEKP